MGSALAARALWLTLLACGSASAQGVPQRVIEYRGPDTLTHAHTCGYSDAQTCFVGRLVDGLIGGNRLPDDRIAVGAHFTFEHGRIIGGSELIEDGRLVMRLSRTGPGAYQLERNFRPPPRARWIDPLRRVEIFYSGRSEFAVVDSLRSRLEATGRVTFPLGTRLAEAVFVGVPTRPARGALVVPSDSTIDLPLLVGLDLARVPEGATAGFDRRFGLILETHPVRIAGGAELQSRQVVRIEGIDERTRLPALALARLPVGPYRVRLVGPDRVTLDERRVDLRLPGLAGTLRLEPQSATYPWNAPPRAVLSLPDLPAPLRARMAVEIVRLAADGPEVARVVVQRCAAVGDPCARGLALSVPGDALAPGRYAARLLVGTDQPGIPHTDYLAAEAPFVVDGEIPRERVAATDMPERPFGADLQIRRADGGDGLPRVLGPWEELPLELAGDTGALDGAGAFLAVLPVDEFTWSCQPVSRRIVGGIHPLTRLDRSRPRLALADPSGVVDAAAADRIRRSAEAATGLPSGAAGRSLPGAPPAPSLPPAAPGLLGGASRPTSPGLPAAPVQPGPPLTQPLPGLGAPPGLPLPTLPPAALGPAIPAPSLPVPSLPSLPQPAPFLPAPGLTLPAPLAAPALPALPSPAPAPAAPPLPAPFAAPADALPVPREFGTPGAVADPGPLVLGEDVSYLTSAAAARIPTWPSTFADTAMRTRPRIPPPPPIAVLSHATGAGPDSPDARRFTLVAPADPGRYQLVLFVGGRLIGDVDAIGNARAVARWPFEVVAGPRGALRAETTAVRWGYQRTIAAGATMPALAASAPFVVELWTKGDRTMGGATVHPRRIAAAPLGRGGLQAAFEAGVTADDWRERGLTSGAHELRLTAANIVLARTEVALQTIEPALEWPGSVGPRPAPDPLAGTGSDPRDQILPVRSACAEPIFRTPPVLRAVVWRGNDPDTPDDDVFEPVASVFPGWPFLIEARFAPGEAAEASYVVTVAGIGGVKVHRTDRDPQVFRSAIVTVQRPAAAEGVGRR